MVDDKKSALARLKASRSSRRAEGGGIPEWNATPEPPAPRPKHSAASSHRANDEYMARMEDGMRSMGITSGGNDDDDDDDAHPTVASKSKATSSSSALASLRAGPADSPGKLVDPDLPRGWYDGPRVESGVHTNLTDVPITCGSVNPAGTHVVLGSTDHALYEVEIASARKTRSFHSPAYGHREWVSCVRHLPDGSFVSGGMDGKLCLWGKVGQRCVEFVGHGGSVSNIDVSADGGHLVSTGYDKTVRIWSTKTRRESTCLVGHKAPVLELAWARGSNGGGLASGDRDGRMFLWDAASSEAVGKRKVSDGHVTALRWTQRRGYEAVMQGGDVLISGGQDGVVKAWDPRVGKEAVASVDAHRQKGGSGAVGDITQMPSGKVVTGGADGHVAVLDPRRGYQVVARIPVGDFVYSLASVGPMVLAGTGAGHMHVIDVDDWETPRVMYALGANKAAVRVIALGGDGAHCACAGDDGGVVSYSFERG